MNGFNTNEDSDISISTLPDKKTLFIPYTGLTDKTSGLQKTLGLQDITLGELNEYFDPIFSQYHHVALISGTFVDGLTNRMERKIYPIDASVDKKTTLRNLADRLSRSDSFIICAYRENTNALGQKVIEPEAYLSIYIDKNFVQPGSLRTDVFKKVFSDFCEEQRVLSGDALKLLSEYNTRH